MLPHGNTEVQEGDRGGKNEKERKGKESIHSNTVNKVIK